MSVGLSVGVTNIAQANSPTTKWKWTALCAPLRNRTRCVGRYERAKKRDTWIQVSPCLILMPVCHASRAKPRHAL